MNDSRLEPVKGTSLVKALGLRVFQDWPFAAVEVVAFLMSWGGDRHAETPLDWREYVGLTKPTYYRVLGWLEAEEVIEVCTDRQCPHRVYGTVGWRVTLRFQDWVESLTHETRESRWRDSGVSCTRLAVVLNNTDTQGESASRARIEVSRGEREAAYAAVGSAHGSKPEEISMPRQDPDEKDWQGQTSGADPEGSPPRPKPPKPRKPTKTPTPATRVRDAFEDVCRGMTEYWGVPITPSVKQMMGGIKWLLDQGYTEDVIIASFSRLRNVLPRQSVGQHRTMWEVYYQNKAELLKQGAQYKVGARPGQKSSGSLLEQAMEQQKRRRDGVH